MDCLGEVALQKMVGRRCNFAHRKNRTIREGTESRIGLPLQLALPTHPDGFCLGERLLNEVAAADSASCRRSLFPGIKAVVVMIVDDIGS